MSKRAATVHVLHPEGESVSEAADRFLYEHDLAATTRRVYGLTLSALAASVGPETPVEEITGVMLRDFLADAYSDVAASTFNRQVATLQSFFGWALRQRLIREDPTTVLERRKQARTLRQVTGDRAIPYHRLKALWSGSNIALREKLFWNMAYDTAARASELLSVDVEDLDLAERSTVVVGKGGGHERIYWGTATARLLPRYIGDRTTGPLFLTERAARTAVARADIDPESGRARLSYRMAAQLFTDASGGWTLHQLRHSRLTHLAEDNVDVALLKAKSRHSSLRSLERYVQPSDAAVAKLTAEHDPERR